MLATLKKWSLYAISGIIICGAGFISGYVVRWKQSPQITVSGGSIVNKTNIHYVPITVGSNNNCSHVIGLYNDLLLDYKYFLNAVPEAYLATSDKIFFHLGTQDYSLSYNYSPRARWSITPFAFARIQPVPLGLQYGGGAIVDYYGVTGMLAVDNTMSLTMGIGYRFTIGLQ